MPYEATIRTIALALLALGVVWLVAAAIGLRPAAVRLRRRLTRAGAGALVCGGCGHAAVSLGSIENCPECGARYTAAGLDGAATASRWAPPLLVVAPVLLGAWLLGAATLAPAAARWANRRTIGAPMVSLDHTLMGLSPPGSGGGPHALPPVAIEIHATLVRPLDPAQSLVPPPLPGSTITVRAAAGLAVAGAEPIWSAASARSPHARHPSGRFLPGTAAYGQLTTIGAARASARTPLVSPWDAMLAAAGPHELTLDPATSRWTLHDPAGVAIGRGTGPDAGALALLEAIGVTPGSWPDATSARGAQLALSAALADPTNAGSLMTAVAGTPGTRSNDPTEVALRRAALDYVSTPGLAAPTRVRTLHPAAPWGLTAAIATGGSLLLVAIILLWLSWRTRTRPTGMPPPDRAGTAAS